MSMGHKQIIRIHLNKSPIHPNGFKTTLLKTKTVYKSWSILVYAGLAGIGGLAVDFFVTTLSLASLASNVP